MTVCGIVCNRPLEGNPPLPPAPFHKTLETITIIATVQLGYQDHSESQSKGSRLTAHLLCNIPAHRTRVITFFAISLSFPPPFFVALFAKFSTTTARRNAKTPTITTTKQKPRKLTAKPTVSHFQNNRTVRETAAAAISHFLSRKGKTMRPFLFTADKISVVMFSSFCRSGRSS